MPQAAGLATESLVGHVGQRIRWARGMTQILRTDNPLIAQGLKLGAAAVLPERDDALPVRHPRLVFLTAPLSFLFFGAR